MTDIEQRTEGLEERLTFQEDAIQKLDEALASQQKQVLDLNRLVTLLMERLQRIEENQETSVVDEKPPHY